MRKTRLVEKYEDECQSSQRIRRVGKKMIPEIRESQIKERKVSEVREIGKIKKIDRGKEMKIKIKINDLRGD